MSGGNERPMSERRHFSIDRAFPYLLGFIASIAFALSYLWSELIFVAALLGILAVCAEFLRPFVENGTGSFSPFYAIGLILGVAGIYAGGRNLEMLGMLLLVTGCAIIAFRLLIKENRGDLSIITLWVMGTLSLDLGIYTTFTLGVPGISIPALLLGAVSIAAAIYSGKP
jgi:hypothetical protein